jgi:hypothetical protein
MNKQIANQILHNLDSTASTIEELAKKGVIKTEAATKLTRDIDEFADKFQVAAFGPDSLKQHQAKVLQRDKDESYMDTFNNVNKVIKSDADEPYMHKTDKSFNADAIDNYDQDSSSAVTDRKEHDVRDLSEWAESTKPQPSWTGGKGGKSTHQGSDTRVATYDRVPEKTWAE